MPQGTPTKVKKRKKSVLKRIRQTRSRAAVNRANRTVVRNIIKQMHDVIGQGDAVAAARLLSPTMSAIDRAIQKGIFPENTANRKKSRLTRAYNAMRQSAKA